MINAFGTSYGEFTAQASNVFSLAGQWDNMIAYETPDFAGFKLFAQYGMGSNDNENESSSNRFYSLASPTTTVRLPVTLQSIQSTTKQLNSAKGNGRTTETTLMTV